MFIGAWLRQLREERRLSQADIEKATGLLRGYISRVENGRTVPSLETLERLAAALDVPLYQLFYTNGERPAARRLTARKELAEVMDGASVEQRFLVRLRQLCGRMKDSERKLLLGVARRLADRHKTTDA